MKNRKTKGMRIFKVMCTKCFKVIRRNHFDIVLMATAAYLCDKHRVEAMKYFGFDKF